MNKKEKNRFYKWISSLFLVFILIFISSCQNRSNQSNGKPIVYASFFPVYDLVNQVAGDTIDLRSFMPTDKDPHLWEPSPRDMEELSNADLLVLNGANMERWAPKVRENFPNLDILTLSDGVKLITYKGSAAMGDFQYMARFQAVANKEYGLSFGHTHENVMRVSFIKDDGKLSKDELIKKAKKNMEEKGKLINQKEVIDVEDNKVYSLEMGHETGYIGLKFPDEGKWILVSDRQSEDLLSYDLVDYNKDKIDPEVLLIGSTSGQDQITYDPHSWMSPVNSKKYLNEIENKLKEKYPENEKLYHKNKLKAVDKLTDLTAEYQEKFKNIKDREFVVTHYAYSYLSRDFDIIQYPLQGLISSDQPSLKTIRKATEVCKSKNIDTIFYEESLESKGADTLANEIDGKTESLNSMELQSTESEDKSYTDILRENLEKIYKSMEGR